MTKCEVRPKGDKFKQCRTFYLQYRRIGQTVSDELVQQLASKFKLGWSHFVSLLSISDSKERRFYEIEAAENSWSVRELERQIASSLYERLATESFEKKNL